jgi:hypothetical protein
MLPYPPPIWDGDKLTLYHGTLDTSVASVLTGVDLRYARPYQDFGRGFYTTTSLRQATFWGVELARRAGGAGSVAVIAFEVALDGLARLDSLAFVRGEFDAEPFWSLVWRCRQSDTHHDRLSSDGWYDLVVGPVAADWRQRAAIVNYDQLSFHTVAATNLLNASRSWQEI